MLRWHSTSEKLRAVKSAHSQVWKGRLVLYSNGLTFVWRRSLENPEKPLCAWRGPRSLVGITSKE